MSVSSLCLSLFLFAFRYPVVNPGSYGFERSYPPALPDISHQNQRRLRNLMLPPPQQQASPPCTRTPPRPARSPYRRSLPAYPARIPSVHQSFRQFFLPFSRAVDCHGRLMCGKTLDALPLRHCRASCHPRDNQALRDPPAAYTPDSDPPPRQSMR